MERSLLIAIGGNALLHAGERGSVEQESANAQRTADVVAEVVETGYRVVLTHGNGPQIGSQLLRSEVGSATTYPLTLDLCVSMTQGEIGYLLQRSLQTALKKRNLDLPVVTLITQVRVDTKDGSFRRPTKPIGPVLSRELATKKHDELGWNIVEEAPRKYRRSVASPRPLEILELEAIKRCLRENMIVIAAGGGGVPVVQDNGDVHGVEAVIDKDRVSALLAGDLHVETFVMLTDVECAYLNFGMIDEKPIETLTMDEALVYLSSGQFGEGSMKPKVESAVEFIARGGKEAVITDVAHLIASLRGDAGTRIVAKENTIN
jgi:carbamate kinase